MNICALPANAVTNDLFARVRPVVGDSLNHCIVAVAGSPTAALLVEYLAACGVQRWLVMAENGWVDALAEKLATRFGPTYDMSWKTTASVEELAAADLVLVVNALEIARVLPSTLPRLAICTSTESQPSRALLALPGEVLDVEAQPCAPHPPIWDWATSAPLMARLARALLLRGTAYGMAAWEGAWAAGLRSYSIGSLHDPTVAMWGAQMHVVEESVPTYRTPLKQQGTLLIAGLGSLGSAAAQQLAPWVRRLVLVDPDRVERVNLVRQAYSHHVLGQPKATALANALSVAHPALQCEPLVMSLDDEQIVDDIVEVYGVTSALVTTGSHADFAISRGLRGQAVTHVVGRCYPRGRFWEGIVVDGAIGPSYEEVRRRVMAGPPATPTLEEIAAYGAVGELVGEPATAMETGWAAMWLARLTAQMMNPATLREGWLLTRLAEGATCFIGGVGVERGDHGLAYGISVPGQVHAWSTAQIDS
jgi:hypothetical protein